MTTELRTSPLFDNPGEMFAAVPVLMHFPPTDSLVVIAYAGVRELILESVLRLDLPAPELIDDLTAQLRLILYNHQATIVELAVLGGAGADPPAVLPHRSLINSLATMLDSEAIALAHAAWAPAAEQGMTWWCYEDPECTGQVPDPRTSRITTELTVAGEVTYASREEMAQLLAPDPPEALSRRAALLASLPPTPIDDHYHFLTTTLDTLHNRLTPDPDHPHFDTGPPNPDAGQPGSGTGPPDLDTGQSRCDVGSPDLDAGPSGRDNGQCRCRVGSPDPEAGPSPSGVDPPEFDDLTIARLAAALSAPEVREACLAFPITIRAQAAELLWLTLTRATPAPARANPAALLSLSAYLRGDGTLATMALDTAHEADPSHPLSTTLRQVVDLGLPPHQFRILLTESIVTALTGPPPRQLTRVRRSGT